MPNIRARLRALAVTALLAVAVPAHAAAPNPSIGPCNIPGSLGQVHLDLGTGEQNGVPDAIGSVDARWHVAPYANAYSVTPHPLWVTVPDANWINKQPSNASTGTTPTTYRATFTLPAEVVLRSLDIDFAADNGATFYLNGNLIGGYDPIPTNSWPDELAAFHQLHHLTYAGPFLNPVQNTLDAVVSDNGGSNGLLISGAVSGCATTGRDPTTCVDIGSSGAGVITYSPAPIAVGTSIAWGSGIGGANPVYAISSPSPWFVPTPPATWISVAPNRVGSSYVTHYEYTFNLPNDFWYGGIVLRFAADDEATVSLNNTALTGTVNQPGWNHEESFAMANAPLHAGPNTISGDVTDLGAVYTGLLVEADVYACRKRLTPVTDGSPVGKPCELHAATDVTAEAGTRIGEVTGGPVSTGEPGTLDCDVAVNGSTAARVSAHSVGAVTYTTTVAGQVSYHATAADEVSLCSVFAADSGAAWWWDGAGWRAGVPPPGGCAVAITIDPNPEVCPALLALDNRLGTALAALWQDCGPYSPIL